MRFLYSSLHFINPVEAVVVIISVVVVDAFVEVIVVLFEDPTIILKLTFLSKICPLCSITCIKFDIGNVSPTESMMKPNLMR